MLKEAAVPRCFGRRSDTRIAVHWHSRAHDDTRKEFGSLFVLFFSRLISFFLSVLCSKITCNLPSLGRLGGISSVGVNGEGGC